MEFLNYSNMYMLTCLSQYKIVSFTERLRFSRQVKLKLKVFLKGCFVAVVIYCAMKSDHNLFSIHWTFM